MNYLAVVSPFAKTGEGFEAGFYIFLALFVVVVAAHLVTSFFKISFWSNLTRPFCLVLLGAAIAFLAPDYPLIYVSCWVSAIGDVLFLRNQDAKFLVICTIVFAAAHTLNAIAQVNLLKGFTFPSYVWAILAGIVVLAAAVGYFTSGKDNVAVSTVTPAYACFHFVNIAFAVMLLIDSFVGYKIMILLGYVVYLACDFVVKRIMDKRKINHGDFYVMLTYLVGQVLIYVGLALSAIA